jgi:hypothetical protein
LLETLNFCLFLFFCNSRQPYMQYFKIFAIIITCNIQIGPGLVIDCRVRFLRALWKYVNIESLEKSFCLKNGISVMRIYEIVFLSFEGSCTVFQCSRIRRQQDCLMSPCWTHCCSNGSDIWSGQAATRQMDQLINVGPAINISID